MTLAKISRIDKAKLSGANYVASLIEQACAVGIYTETIAIEVQSNLLSVLAEETRHYTSGDSSSIRTETAKMLLESILYAIGSALKAVPDPDEAAEKLQTVALTDLLAEGRNRIKKSIGIAKLLHARLVRDLVQSPNVFYKSTAVDGIFGFFKLYDIRFGAHETHITADYPTFKEILDLSGIEFIREYLNSLYAENRFCAYFASEDIHHLLCGIDAEYELLLLNLYAPVLACALGCAICGRNIFALTLDASDIARLEQQFQNKSISEIVDILTVAFGRVCTCLQLPNSVTCYGADCLPLLAKRLATEKTASVFVLPVYPEDDVVLEFKDGEEMTNEAYRALLAALASCTDTQSKLLLLRERIHALSDFEDILFDAELTAEEGRAALRILSSAELLALLQKYHCQKNFELVRPSDREQEIAALLQSFFATLAPRQQAMILKAVKHLRRVD